MYTDEHGNRLLDETETRVLMELQEWKIYDRVAEWCIYGYEFFLVREDEGQHRFGREAQRRYQRKFRLYERTYKPDGSPNIFVSMGGQWHDSLLGAYQRASYVAHCYHTSKMEKIKNDQAKEHRRIAESLRPRYVKQMSGSRLTIDFGF
jgi:hypothetical protein